MLTSHPHDYITQPQLRYTEIPNPVKQYIYTESRPKSKYVAQQSVAYQQLPKHLRIHDSLSRRVHFVWVGSNRIRKLFSEIKISLQGWTEQNERLLPWLCTVYRNEVKSSDSVTLAALKTFLTAIASWSFPTRRRSLCRAIVGDNNPIPGRVSILWLYEELNARGMLRWCACLYACSVEESKECQSI